MPATGAISFSDLQTEFCGTNLISFDEYYKNSATGFTAVGTSFRGDMQLVMVDCLDELNFWNILRNLNFPEHEASILSKDQSLIGCRKSLQLCPFLLSVWSMLWTPMQIRRCWELFWVQRVNPHLMWRRSFGIFECMQCAHVHAICCTWNSLRLKNATPEKTETRLQNLPHHAQCCVYISWCIYAWLNSSACAWINSRSSRAAAV